MTLTEAVLYASRPKQFKKVTKNTKNFRTNINKLRMIEMLSIYSNVLTEDKRNKNGTILQLYYYLKVNFSNKK